MTSPQHPQRCPYLLVGGMSVMCRDSFSPSRCMCDHQVCPDCWGVASHSSAGPVPEQSQKWLLISPQELELLKDAPSQQTADEIAELIRRRAHYRRQQTAATERETVHKRLLALQTEAEGIECVTLADIECLFAEMESLRSGEGVQP